MKKTFYFKKFEENILKLPFFVFRKKDIIKLNFFQKILFVINSKIIILIYKLFDKNSFCFLMNIYFGSDGKIEYSSNTQTYLKNHNGSKIYYPNKTRILGSMANHKYELDNLLYSYSLENFYLNSNDLVIDCGANVGNLKLGLTQYYPIFKYIAFEPDKDVFNCLKLNLMHENDVELYELSLSDKNSKKTLYIDSNTGDSSLEKFDTGKKAIVTTMRLDELEYRKIKLLKIDAEGHELEVIKGAEKILNNIEYITVDMGAEKNSGSENTVASVINYLLNKKFIMVSFKENRTTGLFKNSIYN